MISSDERLKILNMIQADKLSVDDGAMLLAALESKPRFSPTARTARSSPRTFKVRVSSLQTGKTKINALIPMSLVDAGLGIASSFPTSIDEDSIDQIRSAFQNEITGKIIDVIDEENGEYVEVFIE